MALTDNLEEKFYDLAQKTIAQAERIKCPLPDFRDGLKVILSEIVDRIAQIEDEIKMTVDES